MRDAWVGIPLNHIGLDLRERHRLRGMKNMDAPRWRTKLEHLMVHMGAFVARRELIERHDQVRLITQNKGCDVADVQVDAQPFLGVFGGVPNRLVKGSEILTLFVNTNLMHRDGNRG
jgi:hypothetical protein